jgi:hypothetical protein
VKGCVNQRIGFFAKWLTERGKRGARPQAMAVSRFRLIEDFDRMDAEVCAANAVFGGNQWRVGASRFSALGGNGAVGITTGEEISSGG